MIERSAWDEGFTAYGAGAEATDNPYRKLTKKWFEWADGWKDADAHQRAKDDALDSIGWFG